MFFLFYTYLKLQGSQTEFLNTNSPRQFYTYLKLQGSQTTISSCVILPLFYTYLKLQGSQTGSNCYNYGGKFYTYLKLQGSQTCQASTLSLTLVLYLSEITRFSNVSGFNYEFTTVLYLSEITRFSNLKWSSPNLYTWWYCNFRYLYFTIKHLSLSIINVFSLSSTKRSSDSINNRKIFL